MPFVPSPTILLASALGLILAIGGAWGAGNWHGHSAERTTWEAAQGQLKAEAAKAKSDTDNANIKSALEIEEHHAAKIADLEAGRDGWAAKYAASLRRAPRCVGGSSPILPGKAADSGQPAPDFAGSADRLVEEIGRDFSEVGVGANKLAETVRECVEWAGKVGR